MKNKFKDCIAKNQKVIEFKLKKLICNPGELKGTVSIISSDPSCKDSNPLKALSEQVLMRYPYFLFKLFIFISGFSSKGTCAFLAYKKFTKVNTFRVRKTTLFSDKGLKGMPVENRLLEVT